MARANLGTLTSEEEELHYRFQLQWDPGDCPSPMVRHEGEGDANLLEECESDGWAVNTLVHFLTCDSCFMRVKRVGALPSVCKYLARALTRFE